MEIDYMRKIKMEWLKYIIGISGVILIISLLQGCSSMKPISGSQSYFLKGKKIIYSYHKSTFIMGKGEVKGADIESFVPIDDEYASDKNNVYWNEFAIVGVDKDSFKILSSYYSKDKNQVYCKQFVFKEADVQTFKIGGKYDAYDKNYYYDEYGKIIYSRKENDE